MRARICATIAAQDMDELRMRRDQLKGADMMELRLDGVRDLDVAGALAGRSLPTIVTCRAKWEGGLFDGAEEERLQILRQALELGAEYVDIEWKAGLDELIKSRHGKNIVLSCHDFKRTPGDLKQRYQMMRSTEAEIVKLAVYIDSLGDLLRLSELRDAGLEDRQVLIGMGSIGVPSRILPDRFCSAWTYAGDNVAPGQISLEEMLNLYGIRTVSDDTRLYGVLGSPLRHSISPAMHNAAFRYREIDAIYIPMEAANVEDFWAFADQMNLSGASVTAPFKESVCSGLEQCDEVTKQIGSTNTLKNVRGQWHGLNTDVDGFLVPLIQGKGVAGCRATVLGSGGAARGVAAGLSREGAYVSISSRKKNKASDVAALVMGTVSEFPPDADSWDVLINTTPVGTFPEIANSPVPKTALRDGLVYDLVYNPPITRLMTDAKKSGCEVIGGLSMLVSQALLQFQWWTGEDCPESIFLAAAEGRLRNFRR
tara:strand:+ start:8148 stop:9596 length:1449 start_codon:yes stop_codon:yes gene_type:complete